MSQWDFLKLKSKFTETLNVSLKIFLEKLEKGRKVLQSLWVLEIAYRLKARYYDHELISKVRKTIIKWVMN